ncbi:MAG: PAS domain S-box protein [Bryobacteraceae bacterium]|jgi:PAS domain S-box-containing protein
MKHEELSAYLAFIVNSTDDAILSTNRDRMIESWNPGAERLFGYSANEVIGRSIAMLVPSECTDEAFSVLERVYRGETVPTFESERVHKDGRHIPVSLTISPVRDADGHIAGACAIARDISGSKRAQAALRRSEAELREAQRVGQVGSWQFIPDTNTRIWSDETYRILGVDPARSPLSHEEQSRIFTAESWTRVVAAMDRLLEAGMPFELDLEFHHADGSQRWLKARGEAVRDASGRIVMLRGTTQDITARRRTEEALRERDRELEEAQAIANVGSWKWDPKTDTVTWSPELHRIFGHDPRLPAPSFADHPAIISPNAMPELAVLVKRALDTGQPYDFDMEILRPDGAVRWVVVRGLADRDALGQVIGLHGTVQDITERKERAEELRRLNENLGHLVAERTAELQAILDEAPIPIWIAHDSQCRHVTGNVYADQMAMQVPSGGNISASALPEEASVSYKVFHKGREMRPEELPAQVAAATGRPVIDQEVDLLFPDGRTASLLLFAAPLFDAEGRVRGSVTAGADITGLRTAEHLRDSILNSLSDSVAVIGSEGTILMTNEAWNRFARDNRAYPLTAVAPGANYLQICKRAASEGDSDAQAAVDGIEAVIAGHRSSFQFEYSCHSLTERRWFLMNVSPLKGTKTGAVITHTNITDRKLAEIAIRTSESTIRSLLDSSTQSVVAMSPNGKIVLVNGNTQTMFGYTRDELLGQAIEILIPDGFRAKHAVHHKGYFANPQNRPMGRGLDLEGLRKDGTTFPLEVSLSAIETTAGKLAVAFVNDITVRKRLEQAERAHAQEVQALAAGLMTAQEEERRRVSRELHDTICQQLASLAIDIAELAAHPPPPPKERLRRLRVLEARVVKTSEEARHLAYELHPSVLDDLGLVSALRALCKEFSARRSPIVEFTNGGLPGSMPREVAACLYRVTQEALENAAKHSTAKHISVALTSGEGTVSLSIEDDGVGFDIERVKGRGGLGLIGMEERVRMVNGKLSVASQAGRGTRVALTVPLPDGNL